ncbi:MAG: hypothetical protein MRJ68_20325 [Nitrospira sp.]|nr:hypothetical protein [Nitrospira sp.]
MTPDPIVDEVRTAHEAHTAHFQYDLVVICRDLRQKEQASGHPDVSRPPHLRLTPTGS